MFVAHGTYKEMVLTVSSRDQPDAVAHGTYKEMVSTVGRRDHPISPEIYLPFCFKMLKFFAHR
jgi:hypothetical protein